MRSVNKATLIGNVGSEPEVKNTAGGQKLAKLSLATSRTWNDRNGQKQEATEWHRVTFWGKLADVVEQYVHKGDRLYVEGRIEYSQTESDGQTRYWTDIVAHDLVMLGVNRQSGDAPDPVGAMAQAAKAGLEKATGTAWDEDTRELPF